MTSIELRGLAVFLDPPLGTVPVAGPYRPGVEDFMLYRAINNFRAAGVGFYLVRERAPAAQRSFVGVSIWKNAPAPPAEIPQGSTASAPIASKGKPRPPGRHDGVK